MRLNFFTTPLQEQKRLRVRLKALHTHNPKYIKLMCTTRSSRFCDRAGWDALHFHWALRRGAPRWTHQKNGLESAAPAMIPGAQKGWCVRLVAICARSVINDARGPRSTFRSPPVLSAPGSSGLMQNVQVKNCRRPRRDFGCTCESLLRDESSAAYSAPI